jgi:hypothetical protein
LQLARQLGWQLGIQAMLLLLQLAPVLLELVFLQLELRLMGSGLLVWQHFRPILQSWR